LVLDSKTAFLSYDNSALLYVINIIFIFVVLMEKDGGIRPCDVLATCTYKVLHSTRKPSGAWKDKRKSN